MKKDAYQDQSEDSICHVADVHYITPTANGVFSQRFHYHNCFEVIAVSEGVLRIMVGYVIRTLQRGSVILLRNNIPHEIVGFDGSYRVVMMHVPHNMLTWEMHRIPELSREAGYIDDSKHGYLYRNERLCGQIVKIIRHIDSSSGLMRISNLYKLMSVMARVPPDERLIETDEELPVVSSGTGIHENAVDRAFRFIYCHYTQAITLDDVANYANQNRSALCRSFKKVARCTMFEFITRLRIERACELLRTTDAPISDIAYQVGYNTLSHFNACFLQINHVTPSKYRG